MQLAFKRRVGIEEGSTTTEGRTSTPLLCALEGSSRVAQGVYKSCTGSRHSGISRRKSQNKNPKSKRVSEGRKFQVFHRDIRGLPHFRPLPDDGGMRLLDTFEEEFATNIWGTLSGRLAFNISQSVVSLASFSGRRKSITRVLTSASLVRDAVDANKIADNLEIQVYLPNCRLAKGRLQHYNFRYNVALVSIRGFKCRRIAKFDKQVQASPHQKVIAIGRAFETGKLMATSGELIEKRNNLSCTDLKDSTCQITKSGIGGPLMDCDGNIIGMNFYDTGQTPYLPGDIILEVLRQFAAKRTVSDKVIDYPRWHVPEPHWHYPSSVIYVYEPSRTKR
ncbi:hypothetical protein EJB05_46086, partial [Eragrostis curvula]